MSELREQLIDVEKLIREIDEAYLDTIDDVKDQLDAQTDIYELIGKQL